MMVWLVFLISLFLVALLVFFATKKYFSVQKNSSGVMPVNTTEIKLREEISHLESKLRYLFEDPITHLLGWQVFEDRLSQAISKNKRDTSHVALLLVDIDRFKLIHNALGFAAGDALLRQVAERLKSCVRQVDSVSRFRGDTFAILITGLHKEEAVLIVGQRILQAMKKPFVIANQSMTVTVCIGIALTPKDAENAPNLLRSANQALFHAKRQGKQTQALYKDTMREDTQLALLLNMKLGSDLSFDEFKLAYRSIYHLQDKKLFCLESVLTWQQSATVSLSATELFGLTNQHNKSADLVEWVMQRIAAHNEAWQASGLLIPCLTVPIPTSLLVNSQFICRVSKRLQDMKLPSDKLIFQLHGSFINISPDILEKSVNMLRYIKIKLAVTHFGLDDMAVQSLKKLKPDYIFLDPTLFEEAQDEKQTVDVLLAIKNIAQSLSATVVLDCIETAQQVHYLQVAGFELANNYSQYAPLSEQQMLQSVKIGFLPD